MAMSRQTPKIDSNDYAALHIAHANEQLDTRPKLNAKTVAGLQFSFTGLDPPGLQPKASAEPFDVFKRYIVDHIMKDLIFDDEQSMSEARDRLHKTLNFLKWSFMEGRRTKKQLALLRRSLHMEIFAFWHKVVPLEATAKGPVPAESVVARDLRQEATTQFIIEEFLAIDVVHDAMFANIASETEQASSNQ